MKDSDGYTLAKTWLAILIGLAILVFIASRVCAQQPAISITDFSKGLVTNKNPLLLQPGEATECRNFDLSTKPGVLVKRKGYTAMTDTIGWDRPLYGLYAYTSRDGSKQLFGVTCQPADSAFLGLGELVVSNEYAYLFDTANPEYSYIYTGETPSWTTFKNDVFMSNGRQKPIIWREGRATELVIPAPGEPLIIPMNQPPCWGTDTTGPEGEYRYLIRTRTRCGTGDSIVTIADPNLETWTDDSNSTNWDKYNFTNYALTKDSAKEKQGTYCAKIQSTAFTSDDCDIRDTIDVSPSLTYEFSVFCRFSYHFNMGGHARMWIEGIPGNDILAILVSAVPDDVWAKHTQSFTTTDSTDSIIIRLGYATLVTDSTILYYDSLTIEAGTPEPLHESYISPPVRVYQEKIMLTNFLFHAISVNCDTTDSNWDNIYIELYRSRANADKINENDTFFQIVNYQNLTAAIVDTLHIIDSVPDTLLGVVPYDGYLLPDFERTGRDSSGAVTGFRVGAPTYMAKNPASKFTLPTIGALENNIIYTSYICTYMDTLTGVESDSGRSLFIEMRRGSVKDSCFRIGLPPLPANGHHLVRNIYKAFSYEIFKDTTSRYYRLGRWHDAETDSLTWRDIVENAPFGHILPSPFLLGPDTLITLYYLLACIGDSAVKTYVDTFAWLDTTAESSSVALRRSYWKSAAPSNLNYMAAFNDRLWGIQGSRVYWSYLDSIGLWGIFKNIALNLDDGDEITALVPFRDYVKVFKNNSQFILYPTDADWEFERKWVVDGVGCVAPQSMAAYNNGLVYLSGEGVIHETGIQYKDKGSNYPIVSFPIDNLIRDYTPAQKRSAVGFVKDNKYLLSFPAKDTTYVYDFVAGSWSIWTYAFSQATFYDTIHTANITPANDMLFIQDDKDKVFKADTTTADNGVKITVAWKSAPLLRSSRNKSVDAIGFWMDGDIVDSTFFVELYDARDTVYVDSFAITPDDIYYKKGLEPNVSTFFYLRILADTLSVFEIDGIDIYGSEKSAIETK